MKTVLRELMDEIEFIKNNQCESIQEMLFFDAVLSIIETSYIEKEKQQIINAYNEDLYGGLNGRRKFEDGNEYFQTNFNNE